MALADPAVDLVAWEKGKIKGAIRTDFILSAEIIVITLGVVAAMPLTQRAMVRATTAVAMTIAVYGIVAGIVKLDDLGLRLSKRRRPLARGLGSFLMAATPKLMRALTIIGTIAMFMVGGGVLGPVTPMLINTVAGIIAGTIVLVAVKLVTRLLPRTAKA